LTPAGAGCTRDTEVEGHAWFDHCLLLLLLLLLLPMIRTIGEQ